MNKHEMQARIGAQEDEWNRNLAVMKAKAEAASGEAKVTLAKDVAQLQQQFDEYKVQAAKAWDVADDSWGKTSTDLEAKWLEWELRAKSAWNELTKPV